MRGHATLRGYVLSSVNPLCTARTAHLYAWPDADAACSATRCQARCCPSCAGSACISAPLTPGAAELPSPLMLASTRFHAVASLEVSCNNPAPALRAAPAPQTCKSIEAGGPSKGLKRHLRIGVRPLTCHLHAARRASASRGLTLSRQR